MKKYIPILITLLVILAVSCDKGKNDTNDNVSGVMLTKSPSRYIDVKSNPSAENSDPFELGEIVINGDNVEITVSYSGGCQPHSFEIIWDETISLSNPPGINILITHDANGDNCEAYITETISFPLDSLYAGAGAGEVAIGGFSGWDSSDSSVFEGNKYEFGFEESEICNLTVTAREAMCGWGLYESTWFALDDSISAGIPGIYYTKFLQPVSVSESLADFVPVGGKKYLIGAKIDYSDHDYSDIIMCLAYPGPSIPVKIFCIEEVK